ncbi:hypothetical protein [Methanosarcina horonobensis]|uniref:hypothetical protein n=1 Tax=Methanosarcina horonobensis TaxID=418008 RepID=UPI000A685A08|nr:hypothetical protein [Methanosarcina horonobensis]
MSSTAELYANVGYVSLWIGYLAIESNSCVGMWTPKSPLRNNRMEIAYLTFLDYKESYAATCMAKVLVQIAFEGVPEMTIVA